MASESPPDEDPASGTSVARDALEGLFSGIASSSASTTTSNVGEPSNEPIVTSTPSSSFKPRRSKRARVVKKKSHATLGGGYK